MKKTVFISSTFEDLKSHRKKIWDLLEDFDVIVRGMERFGASKQTPLETCITELTQADIYIGIIAFRLGSIETSSGKSFTQLEYEKAVELNKDILIYIADDKNSLVPPTYVDRGKESQQLESFKNILRAKHTIDNFVSDDDLIEKIERKFHDLLTVKEDVKVSGVNEFQKSQTVLEKFLLTPKIYSGREILLNIKFIGEPFPVSREACNNFNLEYGETIGIEFELLEPEVDRWSKPHILIQPSLLNQFWDHQYLEKVKLFAVCQFTENPMRNLKADYNTRTDFVYSGLLINDRDNDGQITLLLTRFVDD